MSDKRFRVFALATLASVSSALIAQTQIDLRTQTKSVDFSGAQMTKPFRTGTSLPATCTVAEVFFNNSAPAGQNLYGCTAANTWTLLSANSVAGDVTGTLSSIVVTAINGRAVSSAAPAGGNVLAWNASTNRWEPASGGSGTANHILAGTSLPATCVAGDVFFNTANSAGSNLYGCTATNVWTQMAGGGTSAGGVTNPDGSLNGTSNLPVLSGTTAGTVKTGARTGNTATFLTFDNGSKTTADVIVFDAQGNATDGGAPKIRQCTVQRTSATVLTLAPNATSSAPCNVPVYGAPTLSIAAPITLTIASGAGTAWLGIDNPSGTVKAYLNGGISATCSGTCTTGTSTNPPDTFLHLWKWTASANAWDASGGTDETPELPGAPTITPGPGASISVSGNQVTISTDSSVIPQKLTGSASIAFGSVTANSCIENTFTLNGAAAGGYVVPGLPAALTANVTATMRVSAANTISVRVCNPTTATISVAADTFSAMVLQ